MFQAWLGFRMHAVVILLALALGASSIELQDPSKTVYGRDDRRDVCESRDELFKGIARNSIAAMMPYWRLYLSSGRYDQALSRGPTLGQSLNLCNDQRFIYQPVASSCSAVLVAPDRVITAGHCISSYDCPSKRFVFNYLLDNFGNNTCAMPPITSADVYGCLRVERSTSWADWAIVHLDRPVVGRVPVRVERNPVALQARQNLTIIGFGNGIPAKIDRGGRVIDSRSGSLDYFTANTDTFVGHGGSGAFDDSGKMVGILVRGRPDYVQSRRGCLVVNTVPCSDEFCTELESAEELTYAWRAATAMPDCSSDSDCPFGKVCVRNCPVNDPSCTGWCVVGTTVSTPTQSPRPSRPPFASFTPFPNEDSEEEPSPSPFPSPSSEPSPSLSPSPSGEPSPSPSPSPSGEPSPSPSPSPSGEPTASRTPTSFSSRFSSAPSPSSTRFYPRPPLVSRATAMTVSAMMIVTACVGLGLIRSCCRKSSWPRSRVGQPVATAAAFPMASGIPQLETPSKLIIKQDSAAVVDSFEMTPGSSIIIAEDESKPKGQVKSKLGMRKRLLDAMGDSEVVEEQEVVTALDLEKASSHLVDPRI